MRKYVSFILLVTVFTFMLSGCFSAGQSGLSAGQKESLKGLLDDGTEITDGDVQIIPLPETAAEKFPAVQKAYAINSGGRQYYAFAASPLGYRDAVNLFIVIDGDKREVLGIEVMRHNETPEYADYITEDWFLKRFAGKKTDTYLNRVVLEESQPNDVIQVTGATVSSQAIINGVNAAMGLYRDLVLGVEALSVPLEVEGFVTEIRTGSK